MNQKKTVTGGKESLHETPSWLSLLYNEILSHRHMIEGAFPLCARPQGNSQAKPPTCSLKPASSALSELFSADLTLSQLFDHFETDALLTEMLFAVALLLSVLQSGPENQDLHFPRKGL